MKENILPLTLSDSEEIIIPGFWRRILAYYLDMLIMGIFSIPAIFLFKLGKPVLYLSWLFGYITIFFTQAYCVIKWGASPGKLIMKIFILKINGEPVGWSEALKRYSIDYIFMIINTVIGIILLTRISSSEFVALNIKTYAAKTAEIMPAYLSITSYLQVWSLINLLVFFFNKRRRVIGDFIAGTVVVKRKFEDSIKTHVEEQKALWKI
ncbi:MAG: hypothetical protein A2219_08590 [Elusimicrobia bacterium RIFOXYA2_FULL_50_26]|nr:MAG: hypothetical protein A2219_08590 [Elusimicrobia bacterium RIFOXYA2_FULL_50_26]OGS25067.1 MAG: hypothetical protein A2314_03025 [Elusimicrobia bacterium RIFOXYB2_FULL_50_12]